MSFNYGWTTDCILNLSLHEIYWRLNKISERTNNDKKFQASLHGIELQKKVPEGQKLETKLDENQKKALDIALKRAKERKRLEFQRNK